MKLFRKHASTLLPLFALIASSTALADFDTNISTGLTLKGPGLAVHGYDVVAYFTEGRPTHGSAKFSTVYDDATYRFATAAHLKTFEKNPGKYLPQFGGYCAYGVSVGAKFDGDPQVWRIVNGKLYLNLNKDIQKTWFKDIPGNIKKAHKNWVEIASKSPAELS